MIFSKACEYGIKAAVFVARSSGHNTRVSLQDIANGIDSPVSFTAKILQKLVAQGIIHSQKGPTGGFEISLDRASEVRLSHIVAAIDGDAVYTGCGLGFEQCDEERPCPVHHQFREIRERLRYMLESISLSDLSHDIDKGISFLKQV